MKKVELLEPYIKNGDHLSFMKWFAEAWSFCGGSIISRRTLPWQLLLLIAKFRVSRLLPYIHRNKPALLVPCCGYPDSFVWPYSYTHEIIPMLWDVWPRYWTRLIASLRRHKVKVFLCTSSQVCSYVKKELPAITAIHVPEGINPISYHKGKKLSERGIDILELGRIKPSMHKAALAVCQECYDVVHLYKESGLLFTTQAELCDGLANAKMTICYPRCDTHPEMAGEIETLTQRYWECMLSRTVMVGRAPKELIDLVGYNPVVEVSPNVKEKDFLQSELPNISFYQDLVDKNYQTALIYSNWSERIKYINERLAQQGYSVHA